VPEATCLRSSATAMKLSRRGVSNEAHETSFPLLIGGRTMAVTSARRCDTRRESGRTHPMRRTGAPSSDEHGQREGILVRLIRHASPRELHRSCTNFGRHSLLARRCFSLEMLFIQLVREVFSTKQKRAPTSPLGRLERARMKAVRLLEYGGQF